MLTMEVKDMYQPYDVIYPEGLPRYDEHWEGYADRLKITRQTFQKQA